MILVGCEESQVMCKAFRDAGFEAYSCDLQPTRGNPDWHFQQDIMEAIPKIDILYPETKWDLIILHPDCTAMALSGNSTYGKNVDGTHKPKHYLRVDAIEWTIKLWELGKKYGKRVALENPKSVIFPPLRKIGADVQFIHPWQYGHTEQKETGFALHNLKRLKETNNVYDEMMKLPKKEREKKHYMSPGPNRKRDRSETYQGIADACVQQWGRLL